ncbi:MAG: helix-turn-helix domain-containing protein [Lachnospiraceae bacterium]|nr:helix-turn-helix domain-containing protein [Lachnospiraceae bacterium]
MKELLNAKDIAMELRCGKNKAYQLMHQSDFPAIKIGGRYLVARDSFEEFLTRNQYKEYALH